MPAGQRRDAVADQRALFRVRSSSRKNFPWSDASIDRILLVHALEACRKPARNADGTLAGPGARRPARSSWCRTGAASGPVFEHTPFGTGRPFSRGQLTALLRDTNFTPGAWTGCAAFPALRTRLDHEDPRAAGALRTPASGQSSPVVLVVEAQKRLYQGLPVAARASVASSCRSSPLRGRPPAI